MLESWRVLLKIFSFSTLTIFQQLVEFQRKKWNGTWDSTLYLGLSRPHVRAWSMKSIDKNILESETKIWM